MKKLMTASDMAIISSPHCAGCGACCRDMGDSIRLDPLDVHELSLFLQIPFSGLLDGRIALHVEDGLILPHLKMREDTRACTFLGEDGRCGIHEFRPGLCRLFPLGRDYDGTAFRYFVVEDGCPLPDRSKVKISRWLEISDLAAYEKFVADWHYFTRDLKARIASILSEPPGQAPGRPAGSADPAGSGEPVESAESVESAGSGESRQKPPAETVRELNLQILNAFYGTPYDPTKDFYKLFALRLIRMRRMLKL